MAKINPYIHFNGNAEEAFTFYQSAFGTEISKKVYLKDLPCDPNNPLAEEDANKILHIALPIGQCNTLMASDVPSFMGKVNESENRSKIAIAADSKEEAEGLYNVLSAGGKVEMPLDISPWNTYFAMFRDKYGIEWMVEYDDKK